MIILKTSKKGFGLHGNMLIVAILLVFLYQSSLIGQDTIQLKTVTITDVFFPPSSQVFDSNDSTIISKKHFRDAGSYLDLFTPLYIRKYGPGLSYSLSIRGSNSAQVQVLWNGIPLNSPMQGQTDLALLRFSEGNKLKFDPNTFAYGLSGALSIQDQISNTSGWQYSISEKLSSTLGHDLTGYLKTSKRNWKSSLLFQATNNKNRFSYDRFGETTLIKNNRSDQYQGKFLLEFQSRPRHKFKASAWLINADRQIPPSLYEQSSDARQKDQAVRLHSSYHFIDKDLAFTISGTFLYDRLIYESTQKQIFSDSRSNQWVQQLDWHWVPKSDQQINVHLINRYMQVSSNAYNKTQLIDEINLRIQHQLRLKNRHQIHSGIRLGTRSLNQSIQWAPFIYYQYQLNKNIQLNVSAGKKFRYPGFNDLFWYQGGNISLKHEEAVETEFAVRWHPNEKLSFENRNYIKRVKNWIQWLPVNGVFQASNIEDVHGRGMENSLLYKFDMNAFEISNRLSHQYNINEYQAGTNKGNQLIYNPKHQLKHNLQVKWSAYSFLIDQQWIDRVYTTTDHSEELNGYYLLNATLETQLLWKENTLNLWFRIDNIFNTQYYSIKNYVMPGRIFELGIQFKN